MLKTGQFAHIADDITARTVIADEFESHGVCTFYLTAEPLLTGNQVMIFPVNIKYFNSYESEVFNQVAHFRRAALTLI